MIEIAMGRVTLLLALVLSVSLAACQPAAPETNLNAASANAQPIKEPFNPAAIEAEVLKLNLEWINATKNRDAEAARRIIADDAMLTYPDGTTGTKADDIRELEAGNLTADSFDILESKVKVLNADVAIVTGRTAIRNGKYKRPNGRVLNVSGEYRFTDVFARRNGTWQVVASHATTVDPAAPPPPPSPAPTSPSP